MTETKQLAMNLSGSAQAALPIITEEAARAAFRRLADLNAAPPPRKVAPQDDVVLRVAVPQETAPFVRGSETSREAAASLSEEALDKQRRLVLDYLRYRGVDGCCDWEIAAAHPLELASSLRRARVGLVDKGYAVDSGRTRKNPDSGKRCVCWVAREYAQKGAAA